MNRMRLPDKRKPRPYAAGGADDGDRAGRYVTATVPRRGDAVALLRGLPAVQRRAVVW